MSSEPSIKIRFFVFLDVVGFTSLSDHEMQVFLSEFLGAAANAIEGEEVKPLFKNTWGDAVLLVFDSAKRAGHAALSLQNMISSNTIKWEGAPAGLTLRIGIHGGPVLEGQDPFTGRSAFLGKNINRAARIEPIAEEGQIFVSQEFAALSEAEGVTTYQCLPQGLADLPKNGGRIRVYRLVASSK